VIYKDFQGLKLSALGFGTMRLPTACTDWGTVDETEAARMIGYAHDHGVNYFDTAFSYHGGESERILGRIVKQSPRDSFYIATKFPGHEIRPAFEPKALFEEQLQKCGVEYFDFYLLHNVYENSIKTYENPEWGIIDYLLEQKKNGRIRHFGFSCHGRLETLRRFLDLYGNEMEFGQIQLNYLDWTLQKAKAKYELLAERNIPVWVMEPVRGGKLAKFSAQDEEKLKGARPDESVAAWAFRWLQGLANVKVILSGMSNMEQVMDNVKTFSCEKPLNSEEIILINEIAAGLADLLPCTACRYCCATCPQKLDIPTLLSYYNECRFHPGILAGMAIDAMEPEERPSACIGCGNCEKACPQNINVPDAMQAFQAILDTLPHWGGNPDDVRKSLLEGGKA